MKQKYLIIITALFLISLFLLIKYVFLKNNHSIPSNNVPANNTATLENKSSSQGETPPDSQDIPAPQNSSGFLPPLDRAAERVTKKPFGIYITPQNSPVQPERFRGYHTGTDFEIFPNESNIDVPVNAICTGTIALKEYASGYGGVLVQSCILDNQPITVIYGHLKLASIPKNAGDSLSAGDEIGILGKAYSSETDGERKHLHLGIHKGSAINIRGYVSTQAELSSWIDPCSLVCK